MRHKFKFSCKSNGFAENCKGCPLVSTAQTDLRYNQICHLGVRKGSIVTVVVDLIEPLKNRKYKKTTLV